MQYVLITVYPENEKEKGEITNFVKERRLLYDKVISLTKKNAGEKVLFQADETLEVNSASAEQFAESIENIIDRFENDSCIYDVCGYDEDFGLIKTCYLLREKGLNFRMIASKCFAGDLKKPILPLMLMNTFPERVVM